MFVVTLPSISARDPLAFALQAKNAGADLLEIRGDITPSVPAFASPLPLIVTPREHYELLESLKAQYIDLDYKEECTVPHGVTVIRSFHDFEKTPSIGELSARFEALQGQNADIVKIATTVRTMADIVALSELQKSRSDHGRHIILGMGQRAHLLRLLSPLRNALTYTYIGDGQQSAPGQLPLSFYHYTRHVKNPSIFGLVGGPDVVSLSPLIHNVLFDRAGIDALYALFPTEDLRDVFGNAEALGIRGLSVTAPFKQAVVKFVSALDPLAEELQTVNTLVHGDKGWKGYCTDVTGVMEGYPFLRSCSHAAILGSGGVVPAIVRACRECGIADITIFARNTRAREAFADTLKVQSRPLEAAADASVDVVFCAIPSDRALPLPRRNGAAHAIDLRYGQETRFIKDAHGAGYATHDGLLLLLHQALAQFTLFTGTDPDSGALPFLQSLLSSHGKQ
ncbi:MAG: type I 3-dehydroquinate dehydratase [Candidatus Peregrinibacteria bacterium]